MFTLALCAAALVAAPLPRAGAQWVPADSHTDAELRGLSVVSPRVVWASGQRGTVVHTVDGGRTWTRDSIPGAAALDLRAIAATSARVAHAISIGDSSRIYRTVDGGRTWSLRWSATRKGTFLDAIRFWDARHGIAMSDPVDGRFLVLLTSDGGESWREVPADRIPPALPGEGGFAASGSCLTVLGGTHAWFASGGASVARVYRTTDRGRTWTVHDTPVRAGIASAGIFSLAFRDVRNGVATGGDYAKPALGGRNLAVTRDGGRTWTLADSATSPAGYRSAVAFVPGAGSRSSWRWGSPAPTCRATAAQRGRTWTARPTTASRSRRRDSGGPWGRKGGSGGGVGGERKE